MKRRLFLFFGIVIGAIVQGFAMAVFLFPHSVPSGGAAGVAVLMNHWFDIPHGLALWLTNIVFLFFAVKYFGHSWTLRTIFSVALTSLTVSFLSNRLYVPHFHLLLDLVAGAVIFGFGVGLLIRSKASSGGMVIPALIIATLKGWNPGKVLLCINLSVFLLTAVVIDYKIIVYAIICQLLSTQVIDFLYRVQFNYWKFLVISWRKK